MRVGARDKADMSYPVLSGKTGKGPGWVEDPLPEEHVGRTRSGAGCWLLPQGQAAPAGRGEEACLFTFVPQCCNQCKVVSVNR